MDKVCLWSYSEAGMAFLGGMVPQGLKDQPDLQDLRDPLVLRMEGPSTPDGGRVPVQTQRALSQSILALWQEPGTHKKEVEPITYACLRTQSIAPPSHMGQG